MPVDVLHGYVYFLQSLVVFETFVIIAFATRSWLACFWQALSGKTPDNESNVLELFGIMVFLGVIISGLTMLVFLCVFLKMISN